MKLLVQLGIISIVLAAIFTTGFECASSEMTSAKLYLQRKEYDNAKKQLLKEVEKNPKNEEAYYLLGREIQYVQGDFRGMKESFDKALAIAPTHKQDIQVVTLNAWGKLYNQGVDEINRAIDTASYLPKAIATFSTAVYILPESLLTRRTLGLAYLRNDEMAHAAEQFTIAFEQGKDTLSAKLLGKIYLDSANALKVRFMSTYRDDFETMKNLASIHERIKTADVSYLLGDSLIKISKPAKQKKGDTKETWRIEKYHLTLAVESGLVQSVKYDGDRPFAPAIDSTDLIAAKEQFNKAVDAMKKAQTMFPGDPDISESLMKALIGSEREAEARALLVERVKKYPESKIDHYNLGVFLLKDSAYADAITEFKTALKLDSSFADALYNIAATYVNWGVAEQVKLKAAGKDDDVSYKERYKMALPYLESVVVMKNNDVLMWELLGQVYANLNMKDKALEAYDKADKIRQGKN
ncbi:MAG TPA: tetratricopeptide repeat protein [Bacteroidota bacterium]|nr:tetratricopeptide repeat protein [Bacteroidota bacterium]